MPITEAHAGRSYPPGEEYEISSAKIAEFAAALGDANPAYRGPGATAPPTFAALIAARAWDAMFEDPELGLALRRVVHTEQRFSYRRPLRVGDRVCATLTIDKVRSRPDVDIISSSVMVDTAAGEQICTAASTFYHSHEAAAGAPA
jgi:acyl dehydratase